MQSGPRTHPDVPVISSEEFGRAFRAYVESERVPISAMLELTYRCNFDCVHCYVVQPHGNGEMTTAEVRSALHQLRDLGTIYLTLTGGEALVRPDFEEIYVLAKELGFIVSLFTNAAMIKDRHLDLLERYPPSRVEVTLYGATEATYSTVTRRHAMHEHVLRNVDRLLSRGVRVKLKAVALTANRAELDAIRDEARRRGVDDGWRFDAEVTNRVDCKRGPTDHRLQIDEVIETERGSPEKVALYRRLYRESLDLRLRPDRRFHCGAGRTAIVVDPYGQAEVCTTFRSERWSLREVSLREAWRRARAVVEAPPATPSRCTVCDKRRLCGACPGHNLLETGEPDTPGDFQCAATHARVEAFCADLKPVPHQVVRALPVHRRRPCERAWLHSLRPPSPAVLAAVQASLARTARRLPIIQPVRR